MQLGVTRAALSRVLNGRAAVSPEMALRLEGWLGVGNGGRADLWLSQQASYDPLPAIIDFARLNNVSALAVKSEYS